MYDAANACGQTVLKSEWLGQVLLYSVYRWFGLDGIIYFRAGLLALCLAIVYFRCRLAASTSPFALVITALAGLAILHHTGERPQLFSFLLLSLLFLLLDSFMRSGKRWLLYCIPPLMLLWSNIHAGALMGVAAMGLFGIGYVLENRWALGRFNTPPNKLMLVVVGLSCVILVVAPSGLDTFKCIIFQQSGSIRELVSEYASPWELWPVTLYYWVFIGVTLVSLPGFFSKAYLKQGAFGFCPGPDQRARLPVYTVFRVGRGTLCGSQLESYVEPDQAARGRDPSIRTGRCAGIFRVRFQAGKSVSAWLARAKIPGRSCGFHQSQQVGRQDVQYHELGRLSSLEFVRHDILVHRWQDARSLPCGALHQYIVGHAGGSALFRAREFRFGAGTLRQCF